MLVGPHRFSLSSSRPGSSASLPTAPAALGGERSPAGPEPAEIVSLSRSGQPSDISAHLAARGRLASSPAPDAEHEAFGDRLLAEASQAGRPLGASGGGASTPRMQKGSDADDLNAFFLAGTTSLAPGPAPSDVTARLSAPGGSDSAGGSPPAWATGTHEAWGERIASAVRSGDTGALLAELAAQAPPPAHSLNAFYGERAANPFG